MGDALPTRRITPKHHPGTLLAGLGSKPVSIGVGLAFFAVTELMHYLLVPSLGRLWERLLAKGLSVVVVARLTARLLHQANKRREAVFLQVQVIAEMNHHIWNALTPIALCTGTMQNQQSIGVITQSVERIEWALREVLPRSQPLQKEDRDRTFFLGLHRDEQLPTSDTDGFDEGQLGTGKQNGSDTHRYWTDSAKA